MIDRYKAKPHPEGKAPSQRQLKVGELIRHALAEIFARGEIVAILGANGAGVNGWRGLNTSCAETTPLDRTAISSQRALPANVVPPKSSATVNSPLVTLTGARVMDVGDPAGTPPVAAS